MLGEVFVRVRNYRDEERINRFDETVSAAVQGSQPDVFNDDARLLELLASLYDVAAHFVESVTDEPFFTSF